ncbi:MAG: hypothetical protein R2716_12240 [Microthrixaceae bacterium]
MRLADPADADVDSIDDEPDAVARQASAGNLAGGGSSPPPSDPPMGRDGDGYV